MWLILLLVISIAFILVTTSRLKWHPILTLLLAAFGYGGFSGTLSLEEVVQSVNTGFGNTIGFIGIVILAGSIIGKFLEKSGGAYKLAWGTLRLVGRKNVPAALSIMGAIVSIPVFCDSGFIILSPLSKALTRQARIPLAAGAMALSLGLILTHSIIPPTPGPVAAAGILGADLGLVFLLGIPVGIIGLASGWYFSTRIASKVRIEQVGDMVKDPAEEPVKDPAEVHEETGVKPGWQPSLTRSLLPIFIPILLIVLRSLGGLPSGPFGTGGFSSLLGFLGQPVVALLIGVFLSLLLPRRLTREMVSAKGWLGEAVVAAATIILITGCGGAFGKVLQDSGIGSVISENLARAESLSILLPVIIAASLKTAQGSTTVAIITGAGIMAPLLAPLGLDEPLAKALVVVALGAGSMIASHANDSYFWVVTQMSGMSVKQGYRLQTLGTLAVGILCSLSVWLLHIVIH